MVLGLEDVQSLWVRPLALRACCLAVPLTTCALLRGCLRTYSKFKAHDKVIIDCQWHPHESSKVATASWDGTIKYWD